MKKYISLPLGIVMALSLSACGGDDDSEATSEETVVEQSEVQEDDTDQQEDNQQEQSPLPSIPENAPTAVPQGSDDFNANVDEVRRMKALEEFSDKPGTTRDGELDDIEAVDNAFQYFIVSTEPGNGEYMTQRQKDMFEEYVFVKKFDINDKQKEELFDNTRKLGMFRAFNEAALKEDEKFEIIAIYLLTAYKMGGHEDDEPQNRTFDKDSITFDRTGKLPTAKLSKSDIKQVNAVGTPEDTDEEGELVAIRYKGTWFVSKQSLTGEPLREIQSYDPNEQEEDAVSYEEEEEN